MMDRPDRLDTFESVFSARSMDPQRSIDLIVIESRVKFARYIDASRELRNSGTIRIKEG